MADNKWSAKDPGDTRDYTINWAGLLGGDTIANSVVTAPPDTVEIIAQDFGDTTTTIRVSGGAVGSYELDATITTTSGQIFNMGVALKVAQRVLK